MQRAAESAPSPSFAGLLATLTGGPAKADSLWNEELAEDVATLSYESALRAHARYRPREDDLPPSLPPTPKRETEIAPPARECEAPFASPANAPSLYEQKLKTASITIRMSQAERDQLLKRATQAGLSVSAYLRSCTLEAESLRAMVKDTLRQLREATAQSNQTAPAPRRPPVRSLFAWLRRLFAPWRTGSRPAHA